jgi:hypothetical protein
MKLGCLNERAVACKGWRWLPGMLTMDGVRIYAVEGDTFDGFDNDSEYVDHPVSALEWPDFTDAATRGCLLELVREAWGEPSLTVVFTGEWWDCDCCGWPETRCAGLSGLTEAEALVAALECAP